MRCYAKLLNFNCYLMSDSKKRFWICLLLGLATAILYWPITSHGFVGFDDNEYIQDNWRIHGGLTWHSVGWAFRTGYASNWHPLTWISHMLDCQLYGLNPAGHHLTNLLLHAASSVLLFILLNQMTGAVWRSGFVAALFAWHPLHVESVAWASERKDVLCAFFWFLAMIAYSRYVFARSQSRDRGSNQRPILNYLLALIFFVLALLSKPMAVTLPFVLLLMDVWPLRRAFVLPSATVEAKDNSGHIQTRPFWGLIFEKAPFFALAFAASVVTFLVQRASGAVASFTYTPPLLRIENVIRAYALYIAKIFWPADLAAIYPFPKHIPAAPIVGAAVALIVVSGGFFAVARRRPYLLIGWLWFLGTLVPVIGIVQVGAQSMADRYTYIPSVGLFIAIVWGVADILCIKPRMRGFFVGSGAVSLAACLVVTHHQLGYWENSDQLFKHTIAVTTDNFVACASLGGSMDDQGRTNEALHYCRESVRIASHYPTGQYNLGTVLLRMGRTDEAIQHFQAALEDDPTFADAEDNWGKALVDQGKLQEAATHFAAAAQLQPDNPEVHYNLGTLLAMESKMPDAAAEFSEALRIRPDYADAQDSLAVVLMKVGRPDEAFPHFSEGIRLRPENAAARLNFGLALLNENKPDEAASQLSEAVRLEPESAAAHYRLALALAQEHRSNDAVSQCREALRLQPDFPAARDTLTAWQTGNAN